MRIVSDQTRERRPGRSCGLPRSRLLEQVPEGLVVDGVMELHFGALDDGAQESRATIGGGLLQIGVAALDVGAENLRNPVGIPEVGDGLVDVVGQVAATLAQPLGLRNLAVDAGLEDGVHRQVGIGVGSDGAHLSAHGAVIADGDADHGSAIRGRSPNLVGGFKVGIQAAIAVHAGVEDKTQIERAGEDAIEKVPSEPGELFLALLVPEEIGLALGNRDVGVHAAAVDADDRLGQEARGETVVVGDLAAEELVELDLVGGGYHFAVTEVDLELRRRDFRMVLLVLEPHGALHFGRSVDELAQGIERQGVIIAAGGDEVEPHRLVVLLLRILPSKQEALDLRRCVEGVLLFGVELVGVVLENAADVTGIEGSILVDDDAEYQHLSVAEDIGGNPVEGAPIDTEAEVALLLRSEAADGGTVKGEVLIGTEEELLVVIEKMEATLEVGEQDSHRLDALFVGQVLEALFADLVGRNAGDTFMLGLQVEFFEFLI